jgi:hypothetical protein
MQTHLPWKELGYAMGGLVLFVALYVGSYFGSVTRELRDVTSAIEKDIPREIEIERADGSVETRMESVKAVEYLASVELVAKYPFEQVFGSESLGSFFSPIHELDRSIRVAYWTDIAEFMALPATGMTPPVPRPIDPASKDDGDPEQEDSSRPRLMPSIQRPTRKSD